MTISNVANKFAMKLGLESRPAPSAAATEPFDYAKDFDVTEPSSEAYEVSQEPAFPEVSSPSVPLGYKERNSSEYAIKYYVNSLRSKCAALAETVPFADYEAALELLAQMQEEMTTLEHFFIEKLQDTQVKSASYMYEPEEYVETDDDRDFDNHWDYFIGELDAMTEDELYNEEQKLKGAVLSAMADEDEPHPLAIKKLKEVRKRMKKSTDTNNIMAEIMSDSQYLSRFIE